MPNVTKPEQPVNERTYQPVSYDTLKGLLGAITLGGGHGTGIQHSTPGDDTRGTFTDRLSTFHTIEIAYVWEECSKRLAMKIMRKPGYITEAQCFEEIEKYSTLDGNLQPLTTSIIDATAETTAMIDRQNVKLSQQTGVTAGPGAIPATQVEQK